LILRGHGESGQPSGPYPIAAYADDLAYIIEQQELGKVVAIGHSIGGMIVLQLAAAYPDCVTAIVIVDSTVAYSPERRSLVEAVAASIEAGDHGPRWQWVESTLLPNSDRQLVEKVITVVGRTALTSPPSSGVLSSSMVRPLRHCAKCRRCISQHHRRARCHSR
jgi:pimeloyl-ACP methyl ester carboxylesterase